MPDIYNGAGERWCPPGQHWVAPDAWGSDKSSRCTACNSRYAREWRAENRDWVNTKRREEYREAHPLEPRKCEVCTKPFTPSRSDAKTCSRSCRSRLSYLLRKSRQLDKAA